MQEGEDIPLNDVCLDSLSVSVPISAVRLVHVCQGTHIYKYRGYGFELSKNTVNVAYEIYFK